MGPLSAAGGRQRCKAHSGVLTRASWHQYAHLMASCAGQSAIVQYSRVLTATSRVATIRRLTHRRGYPSAAPPSRVGLRSQCCRGTPRRAAPAQPCTSHDRARRTIVHVAHNHARLHTIVHVAQQCTSVARMPRRQILLTARESHWADRARVYKQRRSLRAVPLLSL